MEFVTTSLITEVTKGSVFSEAITEKVCIASGVAGKEKDPEMLEKMRHRILLHCGEKEIS